MGVVDLVDEAGEARRRVPDEVVRLRLSGAVRCGQMRSDPVKSGTGGIPGFDRRGSNPSQGVGAARAIQTMLWSGGRTGALGPFGSRHRTVWFMRLNNAHARAHTRPRTRARTRTHISTHTHTRIHTKTSPHTSHSMVLMESRAYSVVLTPGTSPVKPGQLVRARVCTCLCVCEREKGKKKKEAGEK